MTLGAGVTFRIVIPLHLFGRACHFRRTGSRSGGTCSKGRAYGEYRGGSCLHGRVGRQGLPGADGAAPAHVPGARLHHGPYPGNHPGHRGPDRNRHAAAVHFQHGSLFRFRDVAGPRCDHVYERSRSGDPVWHHRRRRLDGFPMAKRGEAGRALSAAYMSSLMGGVFGAVLMAISIPILRPVMLFIGSPELLAFSLLGISMVAVLSGNAPLRGIVAGCLGVMIAMIGTDPQTGTLRWTFDSLYLWDGLPLTPLLLGVFALPELCDLLISHVPISADTGVANIYKGQWQGVKDCFRHWWLIMRCSWIGGGIGSDPGHSAAAGGL